MNGRTLEEILKFPPSSEALGTLAEDRKKYLVSSADKMMLAGYNIPFDKDFLVDLMDTKAQGRPAKFYQYFYYSPFVCVMQAVFSKYVADALTENAFRDLPDMKLKSAASLFMSHDELEKVAFHDALADIRLTREIWYRMNNM